MRQADLARAWHRRAANQPRVGDGVMRRTERTMKNEPLVGRQKTAHTVNLRRLERFFQRQWRKNAGNPFRQHRLAAPGGPIIRML